MPRAFLALLRSFAVGTSQVMRAAEFGVLWRDPILVRRQKALVLLACDTHRSARGASTANRTRPSMPPRSPYRRPEKTPNRDRRAHCRDADHKWPATRLAGVTRFWRQHAQTRPNSIGRDDGRLVGVRPKSSVSRMHKAAWYRE